MRAGLITSATMHAVVLGLAFVSLSSPMPFKAVETEALPVSLVPLGDEMSIRKGDLAAEKSAKPAPRPTEKPQEKPDAEKVGDGKVDTEMPFRPKEKPREVEATPPPPGQPDGGPSVAAQEKTEEKQADISREQTAADEKPKTLPEAMPGITPEARPETPPAIKPEKAPAEKPVAETAQKAAAAPAEPASVRDDTTPVPLPPEKSLPLPPPRPKPAAPKSVHKPQKATRQAAAAGSDSRSDSIEDILAMNQNALIDKTRTQGGGAKRSEDPAAFGGARDIGDRAFQQTLNNIIGRCVQSNWNLAAIGGSVAYDLRVVVHFRLNEDGTLEGEPEMAPAGGDGAQREIIAIQAREALKKCAPFSLPVEKYSQWHDVTINMKAFPD